MFSSRRGRSSGSARATGVQTVTELGTAKAASVAIDDRFRALVETIPAIVYVRQVGAQAEFLYVCSQVASILGWQPEEYAAHPEHWLQQVHPDDQKRVSAAVDSAIAAREPLHLE